MEEYGDKSIAPTGNNAVANLFVGAAAGVCCAGLLAPRPVVVAPRPREVLVLASGEGREMPALVMMPEERNGTSTMERV